MAYELRRRNTVDSQLPLSLVLHRQSTVALHALRLRVVQSSPGVSTLPALPAEMTYSKKYTSSSCIDVT